MELAQYKLNYYFIIKYVNMSRLLYSHIFKFTVLEQANLLYCAVLQQLPSHAYVIKSRYKLYKQKDNVKRNRMANMQIRPSQIMVMLG